METFVQKVRYASFKPGALPQLLSQNNTFFSPHNFIDLINNHQGEQGYRSEDLVTVTELQTNGEELLNSPEFARNGGVITIKNYTTSGNSTTGLEATVELKLGTLHREVLLPLSLTQSDWEVIQRGQFEHLSTRIYYLNPINFNIGRVAIGYDWREPNRPIEDHRAWLPTEFAREYNSRLDSPEDWVKYLFFLGEEDITRAEDDKNLLTNSNLKAAGIVISIVNFENANNETGTLDVVIELRVGSNTKRFTFTIDRFRISDDAIKKIVKSWVSLTANFTAEEKQQISFEDAYYNHRDKWTLRIRKIDAEGTESFEDIINPWKNYEYWNVYERIFLYPDLKPNWDTQNLSLVVTPSEYYRDVATWSQPRFADEEFAKTFVFAEN
ncbi:Uncharacterised protein [Mycoplasmopsis columbinasalis]|uniref:Lipoprotein-associated type-17 domain-containing protein n=2 Tax=Mycoplasmopsis columbinasalis TaxID=114880 RepID=A0A449B9F9_9BACT|nr:Uncharacterised protein [Mycoplasmopsis columbinasalis]